MAVQFECFRKACSGKTGMAYLFRTISYLQRGQLRILRILESNRSDEPSR